MPLNPYDLVKGSPKLSSPPEIILKINEVVDDPESTFEEIAQVIKADTSLSAQLLKMVNSAFFNFPSRIDSISHAVSVIGMQQLKDLALSICIVGSFGKISPGKVDMRKFWGHSLGCAVAARVIAIHCRESNPEQFYLAGILHDIGRLILFNNFPDLAAEVEECHEVGANFLYEAERAVLGFTHSELGAALARAWNLPSFLEEAIACHHDPSQMQYPSLECAVLNVADIMVKAMELGCSGDPCVPPLSPKTWETIGISAALVPPIWKQAKRQYEKTAGFFLLN
ncbi:MAG: HDOD domain-containing protein [Nitrospinae bacterium]|nr:HDOD domain-containing protein [Nitrospinota bacterium]